MGRLRSVARAASVVLLLEAAVSARVAAQRGLLAATLTARRTAPSSDTLALRIAVRMTPGWHIGAEKPGVTGVPTELRWRLPEGWRVLTSRWPAPASVIVGRDTVLEYRGPFAIETMLLSDRRRRSGPIEVVLSYGICREVCIPGRLTLRYDVQR